MGIFFPLTATAAATTTNNNNRNNKHQQPQQQTTTTATANNEQQQQQQQQQHQHVQHRASLHVGNQRQHRASRTTAYLDQRLSQDLPWVRQCCLLGAAKAGEGAEAGVGKGDAADKIISILINICVFIGNRYGNLV